MSHVAYFPRSNVLTRVRDDDRRGKAWLYKAVLPTKLGLGCSQGTAMATSLYKQVSACAIFCGALSD